MARQQGTWNEYSRTADAGPVIIRVFGSELKALRSAVEHGHDVTFAEFGETIDEALNRESDAATQPKAKPAPKTRVTRSHTQPDRVEGGAPAPRPMPDVPQA